CVYFGAVNDGKGKVEIAAMADCGHALAYLRDIGSYLFVVENTHVLHDLGVLFSADFQLATLGHHHQVATASGRVDGAGRHCQGYASQKGDSNRTEVQGFCRSHDVTALTADFRSRIPVTALPDC